MAKNADNTALIPPLLDKARAAIGAKAKPPGSLGRLEDLAVDLCAAQGSLMPVTEPAHFTLFVADHGVAAAGVTAWPQAVTRAVAAATLTGESGCAVLAKAAGVPVEVVDVGLAGEPLRAATNLTAARIREGSRDMSREPALTVAEFRTAIAEGRAAARRALERGARILIAGEAGIGNTTAAACLTAYLTGSPPLAGQGAGATPEILARKREVIAAALARAKAIESISAAEGLRRVSAVIPEPAQQVSGTQLPKSERFPVAMDPGPLLRAARDDKPVSAPRSGFARDNADDAVSSSEQYELGVQHGEQDVRQIGMRVGREAAIASMCGLEIAAMAGFYAEGARANAVILLDGAVTAAAALIAEHIEPGTKARMIAAHLSPEPCHGAALAALGLKPYLDWGLRLGEGTGALLLMPMLHAAAAVMRDMIDLKTVTGSA